MVRKEFMLRTREAGIAYNSIGWRNHITETRDGYSYATRALVQPGEVVKVHAKIYKDGDGYSKPPVQVAGPAVETLIRPPETVTAPYVRPPAPIEKGVVVDFSIEGLRELSPAQAWSIFERRIESTGEMRDGEHIGTTRGIAESIIHLRRRAINAMPLGEERNRLLQEHRWAKQQMRRWNKVAGLHAR